MKKIDSDIINKFIEAMDRYKIIAEELVAKLINETNQPNYNKIVAGNYFEIENADLLNGQVTLTDDWYFDVHGEHCMFRNLISEQTLEVFLGNQESVGDIDPYFFYNFLKTTKDLHHLTEYFNQPFQDTLALLEDLEKQNVIFRVFGIQFRKSKT